MFGVVHVPPSVGIEGTIAAGAAAALVVRVDARTMARMSVLATDLFKPVVHKRTPSLTTFYL